MKRSIKALTVIALGLSLVTAACGSDDDDNNDSASTTAAAAKPKIKIGAQAFGESKILAEIYKQGLEAKGYDVSFHDVGGFRDLEMKAFESGTINFAPEYAASMLEFLNGKKGEATSNAGETAEKLNVVLVPKKLKALLVSPAVDTNAFVVKKATADRLGLKSLSDLAAKGEGLKIGGPSDCETNPFCVPGLKTKYGVDFSAKFQALETGQIAQALDADSIDVAVLFSTDGRIKAKNYVLLQDDKSMLAADNVLAVVTDELALDPDLVREVANITRELSTDALIEMNKRFDIDKEDAADIAKAFLTDVGLL